MKRWREALSTGSPVECMELLRSERLCAGSYRVLLASGGDDQSLRLTHFEITWTLTAPMPTVTVVASVHVPNAHSSALRVCNLPLFKPAPLRHPQEWPDVFKNCNSFHEWKLIAISVKTTVSGSDSPEHNCALYWGCQCILYICSHLGS